MKNKMGFLALAVALLALIVPFLGREKGAASSVAETTFDRIQRTKTIRCSYQIWPPFFIKDPNSGQMSGVYYDLLEKLGEDLKLKIEWAAEVGSADIFEGLKTQRVDLHCSAITPTPERALVSDFTRPFGYVPFYLYARAGDARFDKNYAEINSDAIAMTALDGDLTAIITRENFPKVKLMSLPNLTGAVDVLMNVADGKADAAVVDSTTGLSFMQNNPGKLRQVAGLPLRYPFLSVALAPGQERFRRVLDLITTQYLDTGVIEKILEKYGLDETRVLRPTKPFQIPRGGA